jgi:hypothetical protein
MSIFFQNKNNQYSTNIDMAKFISFDEETGRPSILTSYFITQIRQIKNYEVVSITNELLEAPDFVSFKRYQQNHGYWWVIMIYNNLLDFSELSFGMQIKVPLLSEINKIIANMQLAETNVKNQKYNNIVMVK